MKFLAISMALTLTIQSGVLAATLGAKDFYTHQLKAAPGDVQNVGLAYWIELKRDGKTYKVDSRFPFRSGDDIRFHVCPDVDGYMYIVLDSEAGGNQTLMFPRPGDDNNSVIKGRWMTFPEEGVLTFDQVPGVESLKLVMSTKRLERKVAESSGRSVVVREKVTGELPAHFVIDFAATDPEQIELVNGEPTAASTMVSTDVEKPLIVDLMLRHHGGIEVATSGKPTVLPMDETPSARVAEVSSATVGSGADARTAANSLLGSSPVNDKWAFVVGISNFKNPKWNLNYADKDAKDFASFLVANCGFAPDHVKLLTDAQATQKNVLSELGQFWLPMNAKKDDLVCIYFATHGTSPTMDATRHSYLMCYDTDPIQGFATGIEINDLADRILPHLQSQRVVMILDTCHSGAAESGSKAFGVSTDVAQLLQGKGNVIVASAGPNQTAHDSARYKNGIFTKHLMDGISKYDTLKGAFDYARLHVQQESLADYKDPQTPVMKDAQWRGVDLKLAVPVVAPHKPSDLVP